MRISRPAFRWLFTHFAISVASFVLADFLTTFAASKNFSFSSVLLPSLASSTIMTIILVARSFYSSKPKYFGLHDVQSILISSTISGVIGLLLASVSRMNSIHHAMVTNLLYCYFAATGIVCLRLMRRRYDLINSQTPSNIEKRNILIVGAGDAGERILREIQRHGTSNEVVKGFVDDSPDKSKLVIHGVPVVGTVENLGKVVRKLNITEIIIAMPSASGLQLKRVYESAQSSKVTIKTLPNIESIVTTNNSNLIPQLRPVNLNDLLRRDSVNTNFSQSCSYLISERVMITGAGGSIGSEIARQVAKLEPQCIILVGRGENSIFEIQQELLASSSDLRIYSVIADVRNLEAMDVLMGEMHPTVIFHAAAHKHVPLMEANPKEAITNNVRGTLNMAELAIKHCVKKFVLISTDKAVNPSSVMGATKRVCEKIILALGQESNVEFSAVRFGNVLGSRGSLIPVIESQIRRGGPVTVTDREMTRYFMTIPEATQLVLQAGAIGKRGEIYILDMGQPIKIVDLVYELIKMHNLTPDVDIEIKFTGIRPGEKLHEILNYQDEGLTGTVHPKIKAIPAVSHYDIRSIQEELKNLEIMQNSKELVSALHKLASDNSEHPTLR